MTDEQEFDTADKLTINDVHLWMDGGTVTLVTSDNKSRTFEIEFVQKVDLVKRDNQPYPGSLLLDRVPVDVRSAIEEKIISRVKDADFGPSIQDKEKNVFKEIISDCVDFVVSDRYVDLARKFGRIN